MANIRKLYVEQNDEEGIRAIEVMKRSGLSFVVTQLNRGEIERTRPYEPLPIPQLLTQEGFFGDLKSIEWYSIFYGKKEKLESQPQISLSNP